MRYSHCCMVRGWCDDVCVTSDTVVVSLSKWKVDQQTNDTHNDDAGYLLPICRHSITLFVTAANYLYVTPLPNPSGRRRRV